jgi:hypothetical protein
MSLLELNALFKGNTGKKHVSDPIKQKNITKNNGNTHLKIPPNSIISHFGLLCNSDIEDVKNGAFSFLNELKSYKNNINLLKSKFVVENVAGFIIRLEPKPTLFNDKLHPELFKARIHLFKMNYSEEIIHDHAAHFISHCFEGGYIHNKWEITEKSENKQFYRYVRNKENGFSLSKNGNNKGCITKKNEQLFKKGDSYLLKNTEFHSVIKDENIIKKEKYGFICGTFVIKSQHFKETQSSFIMNEPMKENIKDNSKSETPSDHDLLNALKYISETNIDYLHKVQNINDTYIEENNFSTQPKFQ